MKIKKKLKTVWKKWKNAPAKEDKWNKVSVG